MRRRLVMSLVGIVGTALLMGVGTLVAGNSPELGLDLQGGASVVLRPKGDPPSGVLDQSIEIVRNRVDALGVAEPDISRQGKNIIVQLPGVKDQRRALDIVGQTAELRFRPVLGSVPLSETEVPPTPETTTTTLDPAAAATSTTLDPATAATTTTTTAPPAPAAVPTTSREDDKADQPVVLPLLEDGEVIQRYQLGPAELTGSVIRTAAADFDTATNQWQVDFSTTSEGRQPFADFTTKYNGQLISVVLDGVVKSVATSNPIPDGDGQISGSFSQSEAKDLALVLRFGALPVELEPETVQTVSASLGRDSLRAGITAGVVGLGLVLLYMIMYYRALGLVVILGLCVWGTLMFAIVSYLGATRGLALSLAGAVGIIISVGVTVDSYVVYFERLKDEVRAGKTIRASVDRGFSRAFRTIVAADVASFIGAALLYWLTVGSVRGFAFFLGLSTILDMVVAYYFTRPLVILLGRNRVFTEARWLGVARGLAATPKEAAT